MAEGTTPPAVFIWRDAIWDGAVDCGLPPTARLVGLALSRRMDAHTLGRARPSIEWLMRATGLSRTGVKDALRVLIGEGWIEKVRQGGAPPGGPRTTTEYRGVPRPGSQATELCADREPGREATSTGSPADHYLVPDLEEDLGDDGSWLRNRKGYVYEPMTQEAVR